MKLNSAHPVIAILLLALIGFVSVMLGGIAGKLQQTYKQSPWYPFKGM